MLAVSRLPPALRMRPASLRRLIPTRKPGKKPGIAR
jgi:hypothetical protein